MRESGFYFIFKALQLMTFKVHPSVQYYSCKGRPLWPDTPPSPVRVGPILADPLPPKLGRPLWMVPNTNHSQFAKKIFEDKSYAVLKQVIHYVASQ